MTAYYSRNCDEKNRPKNVKGCYPALCLLGIVDRCSPELASEVSKACAALCSLEEAQHMMSSRGVELNIKTIRDLFKRFAQRARLFQEANAEQTLEAAKEFSGRKVILSIDGGRLRVRQNKRGRKTNKKRSRYHTNWREPKLFIIYTVDENGKQDRKIAPFLDGSLDGPDAIFALLTSYLRDLKVSAADHVLFVADGALWIWDRVNVLLKSLGVDSEKCHELIDFYHAVEHLSKISKLKPGWTEKQRQRWFKKTRHQLKHGENDAVLLSIKAVSKRTRNAELKREREYFVKNESRMQYKKMSDLNLPLGSGAIESSIRRVINLRLKGPCIYWHEETANEMILLRCYYKAKRWNLLKNNAFSPEICAA